MSCGNRKRTDKRVRESVQDPRDREDVTVLRYWIKSLHILHLKEREQEGKRWVQYVVSIGLNDPFQLFR